MENIKEFSKQLQDLIEENERLKSINEIYVKQLVIIGATRPDEIYEYQYLNAIDFDKIELTISYNRVSVYNKETNVRIKSYEELPLKGIPISETVSNTFKM